MLFKAGYTRWLIIPCHSGASIEEILRPMLAQQIQLLSIILPGEIIISFRKKTTVVKMC